MADRSTVFERVQIGKETTPGVAVKPNRNLGSISLNPSFQIETKARKPKGSKWNRVVTTNKDWTEGDVEGDAVYDELPFVLASALGNVTPTTPGGATLARRWEFSVSTSNPDTPASFTLETGSELRAMRVAFATLTELGFEFSREDATISGAFIGQKMTDDKVRYITIAGSAGTFTITVGDQTTDAIAYNASTSTVLTELEDLSNVAPGDVVVGGAAGAYILYFKGQFEKAKMPAISAVGTDGATATITRMAPGATELELVPVTPPSLQITRADSAADLGVDDEILTRAFNMTWGISSRWGPIWTINRDVESWAALAETDPEGTVEITVGADDQGMDMVNDLRENDTIFVRVSSIGPEIEPGFNYELIIDTAISITDIGDMTDEDGVVATSFTGTFLHDPTWGKSNRVIVQCALASL